MRKSDSILPEDLKNYLKGMAMNILHFNLLFPSHVNNVSFLSKIKKKGKTFKYDLM